MTASVQGSRERCLTQRANFRGNPLHYYKTRLKQQLNGEKWDAELGHLSAFGWAMQFSCPLLVRNTSSSRPKLCILLFVCLFVFCLHLCTRTKISVHLLIGNRGRRLHFHSSKHWTKDNNNNNNNKKKKKKHHHQLMQGLEPGTFRSQVRHQSHKTCSDACTLGIIRVND